MNTRLYAPAKRQTKVHSRSRKPWAFKGHRLGHPAQLHREPRHLSASKRISSGASYTLIGGCQAKGTLVSGNRNKHLVKCGRLGGKIKHSEERGQEKKGGGTPVNQEVTKPGPAVKGGCKISSCARGGDGGTPLYHWQNAHWGLVGWIHREKS